MTEDVREIEYKANDFQYSALNSEKRIVCVFKGVGAGGTDLGSHWVLLKAANNPGSVGLIGANTYGQLRDTTLRNLIRHLELYEIPFVQNKNTSTIVLTDYDVEILCRSMDNFEVLAGMEVGWYWLDEAWGTVRGAFDLLNARLRLKGCDLQGLLTTTTDELDSWLYQFFVEEIAHNPSLKESIDIFYATTYVNQHNLPAGYIDLLKSTYDARMFDRMVNAQWVSVAQGKMFYQFDRKVHLKKLKYDPTLPLRVSSDFNVNPMCWSIWQLRGQELWCIDEIVIPNGDTEMSCRELGYRYPDARHLIWYGDASGKSRSTKSINTDYEIIREFMRKPDNVRQFFNGYAPAIEMKVPMSNPSIRDSANEVNARLKSANGAVNIYFDEDRAQHTILSVEGTCYRPGTHDKDDSKDKDPDSKIKTHLGDTVRYIVHQEFPLKQKPRLIM